MKCKQNVSKSFFLLHHRNTSLHIKKSGFLLIINNDQDRCYTSMWQELKDVHSKERKKISLARPIQIE